MFPFEQITFHILFALLKYYGGIILLNVQLSSLKYFCNI